MDEVRTRFLSEDKLIKEGAVRISNGFATHDGQWWLQSAKEMPFRSVGKPEPFWAEAWCRAAAREVMGS